MELRIRLADPSSAATLTAIAKEAKASWGYPPEWLAAWESSLTFDADYLGRHTVFVAMVDGTAAGVCALEDHGTHWMLEHVWVLPSFQRHGVGKALVRHAVRKAAAIRPGVVRVQSDPNATDFYLELGAEPVGAVPAPMPGDPKRRLPLFELTAGA